jgi:hypothetical protein
VRAEKPQKIADNKEITDLEKTFIWKNGKQYTKQEVITKLAMASVKAY